MLELADEWDLPMLTNSYISVYSRPGCATTLPLDTCRPVPDEVHMPRLRHWNINMARNTHHTPLMSSSNWNVENLPYLLKASDLPAGQVKVPHGSTGRAS